MLVLLLFITKASATCHAYTCAQSLSSPGLCVELHFTEDTYYTHPCPKHEICDVPIITPSLTGNCTKPIENLHLPGEDCDHDEDCILSGICKSGTCQGFPRGSLCSTNEDCDTGLFCAGSVCEDQIPIGKLGCLEDAECVNNAGCARLSKEDRTKNVCKQYFSLPDYHSLGFCSPKGETNYLCQSGFCVDNGISQCYPAPQSKNSLPVLCHNDTECVSNPTGDLKMVFQSSCQCSYTENRQSYCGLFHGDFEYQSYWGVLKEWTKHVGILKCNTEARFSDNCIKAHKSKKFSEQFTAYELFALHYPELAESPDCIQQALMPLYWESKKAISDDDQASVLLLMSLLFALT